MRSVLKSMARTFCVGALCTAGTILMAGIILGDEHRAEQKSMGVWLAKDLASQFSIAAARSLARAQKFGHLSSVESESFGSLAEKEFELETTLQAVWLLDSPGEAELEPLSRLERTGFHLSVDQSRELKVALNEATQQATAIRGLGAGLTAVAIRLGDRPRLVATIGDDSLFSRAAGGPTGQHWLFVQRSLDGRAQVLFESESSNKIDRVHFPLADLSKVLFSQSPAEERAEYSTTVSSDSGPLFISAFRTGIFDVAAVTVASLDRSYDSLRVLGHLGLGLVVMMTFVTGLISWGRRSMNR
jgi:hypothetical protein